MKEKIIQQGAEAILIQQDNKLIKRRIKKSYRIKEIDEKLRKQRTKSEAKLLGKASKLISVPEIIKVNEKEKEIDMQFIEGKKLSEHLDSLENKEEIAEEIGKQVAKIHDADIIHGDLTTSNMILVENTNKILNDKTNAKNIEDNINNKNINNSKMPEQEEGMKESKFLVYFIDFGLGFHSSRIEDKAVDLHLLRQALEAKHYKNWQSLFSAVLKGYKESKNYEATIKQLKKVEARGRYKH